LLVNGKHFFPIGTYHVGREDLKRVRELGFNCVTGPIYAGDQSELSAEQKAWHDEAYRQRLLGTELEFVIMVIAVSCVKLLSAHNSTQHTSRKHKV
jgi:hypothetical protein